LATKIKGLRVTVTGQSIPNLKRGAYRDVQNILKSDNYNFLNRGILKHNLSERQVYCITSGIIALLRDNAALMPYINDALLSPRKVV
jgi:hypothetical protein